MTGSVLAIALALVSPQAAPAHAAQPAPEQRRIEHSSPAARRALEFLRLMSDGNRRAAKSYILANYAPAALQRSSADERLEGFGIRHYMSRGARFVRFGEVTPASATVIFHNRLMDRLQSIKVAVEADQPHRILSVGGLVDVPSPRVAATTDAQRVRIVDRFATRLAQADFFSGAVLIARGDRQLYYKAFGKAERRFGVPNRPDTLFYSASIGKVFTATAIAQLAERGKLSWDDPLAKYLPDFPTAEAASRIRIKHLLTHTSGLGTDYWGAGMVSPNGFRSVADYLSRMPKDPPAFEPGTRQAYSNVGYVLLGRIVEIASGEDYYDYLRKHIFAPAGMATAGTEPRDHVVRNLAYGYEPAFALDGAPFRDNMFELPARAGPQGGAYLSAPDLFRFDRALRSGRLLKPETWALVGSPKPELAAPERGYGFVVKGFGNHAERLGLGHRGNNAGVCNDWNTIADAGETLTYVVFSNSSGIACDPLVDLILETWPAAK